VVVDRVDERGLVKVADFGLSRELIVQDYYRLCHSKTPVPVRWMAPESLSANVFTTISDVVRYATMSFFVSQNHIELTRLELNYTDALHVQYRT